MSTPKGNDRQQTNKSKKRSSVAARMANTVTMNCARELPPREVQLIENAQLGHVQDHVLLHRGNGGGQSTFNPTRRSYRLTTNTFNLRNQNNQKPATSSAAAIGPSYFGTEIPETVMEDLLFRFLYNIPDNEKDMQIRVCFQVEQAHWYFVDFYCNAEQQSQNPQYLCKKLGFREFTRQVFYKCDYLQKWKHEVEVIIDEFRFYKSNVPTYGVILLDTSLNYVLLVQGYFASRNSWGFPKGKVNEDEIPIQCAIREALEEVGFDATEKIVSNIRPLQYFLNDTLIRLYIATDVPMDHPFEPHLRKEIRQISWFSVWDLPKDRNDDESCKRLGLSPNNFYTVLPFVNAIQNFVRKEQAKRQNQSQITILRKDSSAFKPVQPKVANNNKLNIGLGVLVNSLRSNAFTSANKPFFSEAKTTEIATNSNKSGSEFLFKPLQPDVYVPDTPVEQKSYTGQTFLEMFCNPNASSALSPFEELHTGTASSSAMTEIKQPKPLHKNLIINVYTAPPSESNTPVQLSSYGQPKQFLREQQQNSQSSMHQLQKQRLAVSLVSSQALNNKPLSPTTSLTTKTTTCRSDPIACQKRNDEATAAVMRTLQISKQSEKQKQLVAVKSPPSTSIGEVLFNVENNNNTVINMEMKQKQIVNEKLTNVILSPLKDNRPSTSSSSVADHPSETLRLLFASMGGASTLSNSQLFTSLQFSDASATNNNNESMTIGEQSPLVYKEPVFCAQLCEAWKNFRFDRKQISLLMKQ